MSSLRVGYADPPYPRQAERHYNEREVDHAELLKHLDDSYDGWLLHTSSTALEHILYTTAEYGIGPFRIMAWVKPFCAFKRNVSVAYAWEPVLIKACRKPVVNHRVVMRDFVEVEVEEEDAIRESITMKKGLTGVKPEKVCRWAFEMLGLEPDDHLVDLYPGSGAVTQAWNNWRADLRGEV